MAQPTISRYNMTDDDGSNTTGTVFDDNWLQDFFDRIDAVWAPSVVFKSANHTLVNTEDVVICTGGAFTVTLHAANDATRGTRQAVIKNATSGDVTVDGDGSETIDGELYFTLGQWESVTIISTGSQWLAI